MKKWMKILISTVLTLLIVAVGAFLYIDHKVTKAMVDMSKKQEQMELQMEQETQQMETDVAVDLPYENDSEDVERIDNNEVSQSITEDSYESSEKTVEVEDEELALGAVTAQQQSSAGKKSSKETKTDSVSESQSESSNQIAEISTERDNETSDEVTNAKLSENQTIDKKDDTANVQVTEEKPSVSEVTEDVSFAEKAKAYELALSRLTTDQIDRLYQLAAGGFTREEKEEAKAMFYANFTAEEQKWILEMYSKYY